SNACFITLRTHGSSIMRPVIVVGDATSHGGKVLAGSASSVTGNKQIARMGDPVSCPREGHSNEYIATGDPSILIEGQPIARHGDKTSCGASLISSQRMTAVGTGPETGSAAAMATGVGQAPVSSNANTFHGERQQPHAENLAQAGEDGNSTLGKNHSSYKISK